MPQRAPNFLHDFSCFCIPGSADWQSATQQIANLRYVSVSHAGTRPRTPCTAPPTSPICQRTYRALHKKRRACAPMAQARIEYVYSYILSSVFKQVFGGERGVRPVQTPLAMFPSRISFLSEEESMIRRLNTGGYRLYSRKKNPKTGKRRNLGTFKTLRAAEKHEREVQYFKRH